MKDRASKAGKISYRSLQRVLAVIAGIALCLVGLYWIGTAIENQSEMEEPRGDLRTRFTEVPAVPYNGALYQPKTKLTTIAVMGIDQDAAGASAATGFRNGGQADFLMLLILNAEDETITPIQIDRDTIAEVTVLGILGNVTGTRATQICLSHGFGDGGEQSSALTRDAISRLFLGVNVQYYVAMNLDGIPALNDALGGVRVTLEDDFSSLDTAMAKGVSLVLQGRQAEYYVRSRMNIGIGTNESRMVRQQVYWQGISDNLAQRLQADDGMDFIENLFDLMEPYLTTDMKRGRLINEIWNARDYQRTSPVHPAGAYAVGQDGFMEFHLDEPALEALIMGTFYSKVS